MLVVLVLCAHVGQEHSRNSLYFSVYSSMTRLFKVFNIHNISVTGV